MVEHRRLVYGKHTCITYNGCTVVDYTIVSQELLNCISIFQVDKFTALSNHCPIVCSLYAHCNYAICCQSKLDPLPGKFIWSDEAIEKLLNLVKVLKSS
jgi:hypothetical protein